MVIWLVYLLSQGLKAWRKTTNFIRTITSSFSSNTEPESQQQPCVIHSEHFPPNCQSFSHTTPSSQAVNSSEIRLSHELFSTHWTSLSPSSIQPAANFAVPKCGQVIHPAVSKSRIKFQFNSQRSWPLSNVSCARRSSNGTSDPSFFGWCHSQLY